MTLVNGVWTIVYPSEKKIVTPLPCAQSLQSCLILCDAMDQAPLTMGFSTQEHWSRSPFPSPGESSRLEDETLKNQTLLSCIGRWILYH